MIRLRVLRWESHPGFPRRAQSNHKESLRKGGRRVRVKERDVIREAEAEFMALQQGGHEPRNAGIL